MIRIVHSIVIMVCVLLAHAPARADVTAPARWRARFDKRAGCFVAHEIGSGQTWRSRTGACARRRPPFSTFKIPHSLIGLDTGVLADAEAVIPWDRERHPAEDWWPATWQEPHTLRSAMANSVVPYYRALAGRIGADAMKRYLRGFDYGNQAMGPQLDNFWLGGDLAISADEQVAFLTRLQQGRLPVSARTAAIVQDILVLERTPGYVLRGKTGSGPIGRNRYLGWLVGQVETCGKVYAFAFWIEAPTMDQARAERLELTRAMLSDLGALPADASACAVAPAP
jgi:beta-lactamase class D